MKLSVLKKDVYGKTRYYPTNDFTKTLCELIKKKTLNEEHLNICRDAKWIIDIHGYTDIQT